mgnify:CR=1 FL=1
MHKLIDFISKPQEHSKNKATCLVPLNDGFLVPLKQRFIYVFKRYLNMKGSNAQQVQFFLTWTLHRG